MDNYCATMFHNYSIDESRLNASNCCKVPFTPMNVIEIAQDPSYLLHPSELREDRAKLLAGEKIDRCKTCWQREELGLQSRRQTDNARRYTEFLGAELGEPDINTPQTLDYSVFLGNLCNLKCGYCSPRYSSQWATEVKVAGPFGEKKVTDSQINDAARLTFQAAWEQTWPTLVTSLRRIMFTGGEPFMHPRLWEYLDRIKLTENPNLIVDINTNLVWSATTLKRWLTYSQELTPKVKKVRLLTSLDMLGRGAEVIRLGLNVNAFLETIETLLKETDNEIRITSVYSVLSAPYYAEFLKGLLPLRERWGNRFNVTINVIDYPDYLTPYLLPRVELVSYVREALLYAKHYNDTVVNELERMRDNEVKIPLKQHARLRSKLNDFVDNQRSRLNNDYLHHFPHLVNLLI